MPPESPPGHARRGRKDPTLLGPTPDLEAENQLDDAGDPSPGDGGDLFLLPGDVVACKVTHQANFDGQDSYYSYGIQTRVADEETEEEVFTRVATLVNGRVIDLIAGSEEVILQLRDGIHQQTEERAMERRSTRRITPR